MNCILLNNESFVELCNANSPFELPLVHIASLTGKFCEVLEHVHAVDFIVLALYLLH
jgi:hypothetical protein